jgi:transcriptional regulator with XRE-family HTH domain
MRRTRRLRHGGYLRVAAPRGNGGTRLADEPARRADLARIVNPLAVGHMSDDIDLHLGKRMRRRRRLLGLTQEQLANACGVRFQQIQKYECGANRVSAARLFRIARALDVQMNYFFEGLAEGAATARDETIEVVRSHPALGERPRRQLLDVSRSLRRDTDAA